MVTCPHCEFANPGRGDVCGRCGGQLFALSAATLPAPLPAPMVEPILPLPAPPPDGVPLAARPALTRPFGKSSVVSTPGLTRSPDTTPIPATIHDLCVTELQDGDRIASGGTAPARPGLPGHPMNDS